MKEKASALVVLCLLLGVALEGSRAAAQPSVAWEPSLAGAFEKAKAEKRLVLIAFNMDREPANDAMASEDYHDPTFVALASQMVCVIASKFEHEEVERDGRPVCTRFGSVRCSEHQAVDIDARREILGGAAVVVAPQHIVLTPDRVVLARRRYQLSASQLAKMLSVCLEAHRAGRPIPEDALPPELAGDDEALPGVAPTAPAPPLEEAIAAFSTARREGRVQLLGRIVGAEGGDEVLAGLIKKFGSKDDTLEILDALGELARPEAIPHLLPLTKNPLLVIREHAAIALERIADPAATEPLLDFLKREKSPMVKRAVIRALGVCGQEDDGVATTLLRMVGREKAMLELNAIYALRHFARSEKVKTALYQMLVAERNHDRRKVLVFTLACLGEERAIPVIEGILEKLKGDYSEYIYKDALQSLRDEVPPDDDSGIRFLLGERQREG